MNKVNLHDVLTKAILIATMKHAGQIDKGGHPYILHPLTVMANVDTLEQKIIAVLHDVIEDTDVTGEELITLGIPEYLVHSIMLLSKLDKKEDYLKYIKRIKEDKNASEVKKADLKTNMDISRIPNPQEKDINRVKKYEKAYEILCS